MNVRKTASIRHPRVVINPDICKLQEQETAAQLELDRIGAELKAARQRVKELEAAWQTANTEHAKVRARFVIAQGQP